MSAGTRGKYAEGKVKDELKKFEERFANFTYNRIPDARAGSVVSVPGDFQAFYKFEESGMGTRPTASYNFLIEVKETTLPNRLPYQNFSVDGVARARKRQMAGGIVLVLVCCKPTKTWRLLPLSVFQARNPETPSGSWKLDVYPTFDQKQLYDVLKREFML